MILIALVKEIFLRIRKYLQSKSSKIIFFFNLIIALFRALEVMELLFRFKFYIKLQVNEYYYVKIIIFNEFLEVYV